MLNGPRFRITGLIVTDRGGSRAGYFMAGALAVALASIASPALAVDEACDPDDARCTQAVALVETAIAALPELAEIEGYVRERRERIMAAQTAPAQAAMMRDERRFKAGLAGLLTASGFEGAERRAALNLLKARWRSLDRTYAMAEHVNGYWENTGGSLSVIRSGPGTAQVSWAVRGIDGELVERCAVSGQGDTGGTSLALTLEDEAVLTLTMHDGALWTEYRGSDGSCAAALAQSDVYFSADREIGVPSL